MNGCKCMVLFKSGTVFEIRENVGKLLSHKIEKLTLHQRFFRLARLILYCGVCFIRSCIPKKSDKNK